MSSYPQGCSTRRGSNRMSCCARAAEPSTGWPMTAPSLSRIGIARPAGNRPAGGSPGPSGLFFQELLGLGLQRVGNVPVLGQGFELALPQEREEAHSHRHRYLRVVHKAHLDRVVLEEQAGFVGVLQ